MIDNNIIINAMKEVGCEPQNHDLIIDDRKHRFKPVGDKNANGVYCFKHTNGDVIGWFINYKEGVTHKYFTRKDRKQYTKSEKLEFKKRIERERKARQRQLQQQHERSASKAQRIWDNTKRGEHPYLERKQASGIGTHAHKKSLIVPAYKDGVISTLQFISYEGDKRFLFGGDIQGAYGSMGKDTSVIYISEGYASADAVYQAVKPFVSVWAFTAGNLQGVAEVMRGKYPDSEIIICADNDAWQKLQPTDDERVYVGVDHDKNIGIVKGRTTAMAVDAKIIWPDFTEENKETDFNDYLAMYGKDVLLKRLEAASFSEDLSSVVIQSSDQASQSSLLAPPSYLNDVPSHDAPPHDVYFDEMNAPAIPETDYDWQAELIMDSKGNMIKNSLSNTELMLNHHDTYRGVFRYNEFKSDTMVVRCPPWIRNGKFRAHRLDDNDLTKCTSHMEKFGLKPDTNRVFRAIKSVAYDNKFHPVKEYFDSLVWDGTPRLDKWLAYYLGAEKESTDYLAFIGTMWLKAAVARIYNAGCKFDHMLVLEGRQGVGKSTVLRELATFGDEGLQESYFTDGIKISDIGSKDLIQLLQGSMIVELAELAGFSKKDDNEVKNWITNQVDRCRLPYEKTDTDFPRQFVLSATTNDYEYLKDPTGNRRYWPIEVGKIDLDAVKRDRLQLWAEAVSLYKADNSLWPNEEQIALCKAEQDKRRNTDVWENKVLDAIGKIGAFDGSNGFETDRIMIEMGLTIRDMGQSEKTRVNNILRSFGYEQKRKRRGDGFKRVWTKE